MAAYKDEARGTWYVSFHYNDWTGKNKRKLKRGFRTRKEALEYEQKFLLQQATNLDMRFEDLKFKTAGKAVKNERKKGSRSAAKNVPRQADGGTEAAGKGPADARKR